MSRYHALAEHLKHMKSGVWEASFDEIERVMGKALPPSAFRYPAWWANQTGPGHSQTAGWRKVGWRTAGLDLACRRVRFERDTATSNSRDLAANDDELFEEAGKCTGIGDRSMLIREALGALIARESAARLARLGGSMPDFKAPRRDRVEG